VYSPVVEVIKRQLGREQESREGMRLALQVLEAAEQRGEARKAIEDHSFQLRSSVFSMGAVSRRCKLRWINWRCRDER
jgi:hypothetical protein